MAEALDTALAHLERYPTDFLFPLKRLSKFPPLLKKNLSDNCSNDPAQLMEWSKQFGGPNWGVAHRRSRILVADLDVSGQKQGRATYDALEALHGWPTTSRVKTPSGGYHCYYRGQHVMKVGGFGPGLDSPNYTVLPGMKVQGGGSYRYVNAHERAQVPWWFYSVLAKQPSEGTSDARDVVVELDQEHNVEHAIRYLKHEAPPAKLGDGGEFRTMKTAMVLRDLGISEELAVQLLYEHYNPRCDPPWYGDGADSLEQKAANGFAFASKSAHGGRTAEYEFAGVEIGSSIERDPDERYAVVAGEKIIIMRTPRAPKKKKSTAKGPKS